MGKDLSINDESIDAPRHVDIYIHDEYTFSELKELCNSLMNLGTDGIKLAGLILTYSADELYETNRYVHMKRYKEDNEYYEDLGDFRFEYVCNPNNKKLPDYQIENLYNGKKEKLEKAFEEYVEECSDREPSVFISYC